ncbi:MAG: amino acid ABC transporter permease [Chloroflexota bacterium]
MNDSSPTRPTRSQRIGEALRHPPAGAKTVAIATASTIIVLAVVAYVVVSSPGWERAQAAFFDFDVFGERTGQLLYAFRINIQIFVISQILVLVGGLALAVMRSLQGPVFFPFRAAATIYIDVFRGVPSILIIFLLGFGVPALRIPGMPNEPFFWAVVVLTLIWSAYVAEVYRAGIESVHPSQNAAARSLGLTASQSMRYVVLPQAVRRVIPPLLNDSIGLLKDTALVSFIGAVEIFRRAQIVQAAEFNFTVYLIVAVIFLAVTIPMSRFVDWLVARDRRRQMAGAR